ncbi:MAG: hypothetical protein HY826_09830 [Actinobacteria bacterium]|nr:hypothetical protein [Actinomycetota bacterium]
MHHRPTLLVACWLLVSCTAGRDNGIAGTSSPGTQPPTASAPLDGLRSLLDIRDAGAWRAAGIDEIEVWVCQVPADSTAPMYSGLPLRLALTAVGIAEVLNRGVTAYFGAVSHGQYLPQFYAGGEATLASDSEPQACVEQAINGAEDTADVVLVVANAEHRSEFPGGFGNGGNSCPAEPPCPVLESRRSAYVGASDFHPDWGDRPPFDLVEHELGHTLGWIHSAFVDGAAQPYQSALDLMSDSAAPRAANPERRDAPDVLAVDRLLANWLPESAVWVAPATGGSVALQPSTAAADGSGTRLAMVVLGAGSYLTIEWLPAEGFNAHLVQGGIAVHFVEVVDGAVRSITPVVGVAPFTDLLQVGESVDYGGWHVAVVAADGNAITVSVAAPV